MGRALIRWAAFGMVATLLVLGYEAHPALGVPTGFFPWGVAVNPKTNLVYVANEGADNDPSNDSVWVFDGGTNALVAVILVQDRPKAVAVNPVTNRIYVGNWGSNSVSVIDGGTNSVIATLGVGPRPFGVAVNTTTNRIYVTNSADVTVSVIDGATNAVTPVPVVCCSRGIGVNPSTNRVYVPSWDRDEVWVLNGATNGIVTSIPVGPNPVEVGVNPLTNRIYVSNNAADHGSPSVSVIDGATNSVIATVPVGRGPRGIGVDTSTNRVYVANANANRISVINGASNTVVDTIPVGAFAVGVATNTSANRTYVTNNNNHNFSVLFGNEYLRNNSFDGDDNNDGFPDGWTGQNLFSEDRLVADVYEGRFSFAITGLSRVAKALTQTISVSGPAKTVLHLEALSKADGTSPTGGQYRITVDVTSIDGTVNSFHVDFTKGSHDWERKAIAHKASKAFKQITVTIIYSNQLGTALFDAVHVWRE